MQGTEAITSIANNPFFFTFSTVKYNIDTASFANITGRVMCGVSNVSKPLELHSVAQVVIKAKNFVFLTWIAFTFLFHTD